jgi:hypothetical protein
VGGAAVVVGVGLVALGDEIGVATGDRTTKTVEVADAVGLAT